MINTQKLVEYIAKAPFPEAEKRRLVTLACVADEEHKRHIYVLVKKFTERIYKENKKTVTKEEADRIRNKGKVVRRFIRRKAEDFSREAEEPELQHLEEALITL